MPPTNDFLPFCPTDTGTNLLSEADYTAAADRVSGNKPGIASAKLNNRAIRQANAVASQIAQFVANKTGADVLDDGIAAKFLAQISGALTAYPPNFTKFVTGSGNFNLTYIFQIASGSATAAATYTNNGVTYTVVETVASGVSIRASGNGAPTAQGTLTKASGTGDATLTFYAVRAPVYLNIIALGGGGGGAGSSISSGGNTGTAGGNTTFGTSLLVANGGSGGVGFQGAGGAGGTASLGTGPFGIALSGSQGASTTGSGSSIFVNGGNGGAGALGGGGGGATSGGTNAGFAAATNTGSGGGGASSPISGTPGSGGGAGGFVDAIITSPSSTYAYSVGTGGAGGTAGTSGQAGGSGAAGIIEVLEHYQ